MYFHSPLLVVSLQFTEVCGVARGDIVWRTTVEEPRKDTGDLAFRSKVKSQKSKVKSTVVLAGDGTETRRANVKPSSLRAKQLVTGSEQRGHESKERQRTQGTSIQYDASMGFPRTDADLHPLAPPFSCAEHSSPQICLARSDSIA